MVNNQNEFNNTYPKKTEEIEINYEEFEEKQLIIEDYSELEKLELREIDSIGEITLKNLTKLQKCTI